MLVDLTLGGALLKYLPDADPAGGPSSSESASQGARKGNRAQLEIEEGSSIADALRVLGVPSDARMMVICDGDVITPDEFASTILISGSKLSVIPPIQAG